MKKVYIVPNLVTTCNFFCGLLGLIFAMEGQYLYAAEACVVAMLFDFVDGQVARVRGATTRFGIEYDSLADMVSFGILPTSMGYLMVLHRMGRIGLGVSLADPDVVYAIIEAADDKSGFFRSTDRGESWEKRSDQKTTSPQYYNEIVCDPLDVDRVYVLDTFLQVTEDGGKTWFRRIG